MQSSLVDPSPKLQSAGAGLEKNQRILVVDDNEAIHADFRKILGTDLMNEIFEVEEAEVFGSTPTTTPRVNFEMDFAFQGEEALTRVQAAMESGRRYAVVFMDVRMPPGWDGVETTLKLWEVDPDLQIVICTAYSDYPWEEMMKMIGSPERLLILKKPFDTIEVLQFAHALTEKWSLLRAVRCNTAALERAVDERTYELQGINALLEAEITRHKAAAEYAMLSGLVKSESAKSMAAGKDNPGRLSVFPREHLLHLLGGDEALLRRMTALFRANTPRLLDEIRDSITRRQADALRHSAYALSGPFGTFGAREAHRLALQLEKLGEAGDFTAATPLLLELRKEVQRVGTALEQFNHNHCQA